MNDQGDPYYRLVNRIEIENPTIQYLRFPHNGWLLESVSLYHDGLFEHDVASDMFALAVTPIEVEKIAESGTAATLGVVPSKRSTLYGNQRFDLTHKNGA